MAIALLKDFSKRDGHSFPTAGEAPPQLPPPLACLPWKQNAVFAPFSANRTTALEPYDINAAFVSLFNANQRDLKRSSSDAANAKLLASLPVDPAKGCARVPANLELSPLHAIEHLQLQSKDVVRSWKTLAHQRFTDDDGGAPQLHWMAFFTDALLCPNMLAGRWIEGEVGVGWFPTMSLQIHFHRVPAPAKRLELAPVDAKTVTNGDEKTYGALAPSGKPFNWFPSTIVARAAINNQFEVDSDIFDSAGNLCASARQLMSVASWEQATRKNQKSDKPQSKL